jgi:hypothetical protein
MSVVARDRGNWRSYTLTLKYVCKSIWNSNASVPSFRTFIIVCSPSLLSVTLYTTPKSYGHFCLQSSDKPELYKPKSSFTLLSSLEEGTSDSDVDLPKNSHRTCRAKPCCGRLEVGCPLLGGGPKTYVGAFSSQRLCGFSASHVPETRQEFHLSRAYYHPASPHRSTTDSQCHPQTSS